MNEKSKLINLQTVGMPHAFCLYQLSDGNLVNADIIDTAGQEKYRALGKQFYQKADGCLLVYDITNRKSFEEIQNYYVEEIKNNCKFEVKVMLLGNKTDLEDKREISSDEGAKFAASHGYMFLETSCVVNRNVADSFETLIELAYRDVLERNPNKQQESHFSINESKEEKKVRTGCC